MMFKGLSPKIWLPFTIVLTVIAIAFNIYYPNKQEEFYIRNKNNELKELAKTVGLGVELSLSEDNFEGLKRTLDFASERKDFEFVAIVMEEEGTETVFASYPVLDEKIILTASDDLLYQKSSFSVDETKGHILIASSKEKMNSELNALNRPIYLSTVLVFLGSFLIYVLIAKRITRPLNKLVSVTSTMADDEFTILAQGEFGNDEIGLLGNSISSLQEKLLLQRKKNKELYDGLEDEIKTRTQELANVTNELIESQKIASIANYTINVDSGKVFLPSIFFNILNKEFTETIGLDELETLLYKQDISAFREIISDTKFEESFRREIRFKSADDQIRWFAISGVKKRDEKTGHSIIPGLLQDITDRKNYESQIKRLSLVAEKTSNCVIITDASRRIIWANESAQRLTEYSLDEMLGNTPKMFQFEKTNENTIEHIRHKIHNDQEVNCEILNRSKSGKEYWLELNIVPLFDENKTLYGYIAVETDITEMKNASLELLEREKQLTDILDNSAEMIHTLDVDGNVIWANRSWKENLRVSDKEIRTKNIMEFLDEPTKLEFQEIMPKLSTGERVDSLDCGFYSTQGDLIVLKGQAIPLFKDGKFIGSQAYLHNVTQVVRAENELKSFTRMQKLLMDISFDFLNVEPLQSTDVIRRSIIELGEFIDAKRIYISITSNKESILNQDFFIHRNDQNNIEEHDSVLITFSEKIPILRNKTVIGEITVIFKSEKKLSSKEIELLSLFAAMLVNVENRYLSAREINLAKQEIESINSTLESKVLENTKRNLDLSKTIVEQEKMATIGEISAGIAHDLNTPLGAIKIGAESISYSLDNMFRLFPQLQLEEIVLLFELSKNRKIEIFVGGLQLIKESKDIISLLDTLEPEGDWNKNKIAELLVKCRFSSIDKKSIIDILKTKNPETFLEILYTILTAYSMLSSLNDSVLRASEVVQNIRSFIKKDISNGLERKEIKLKENIKVVLNIFSFEFKRNVDLSVDIDDHLIIHGFDVKLFQLWSNLIKNALDAMDRNDRKNIIIKGFKKNDKIIISIANNGPMIPEEIQHQIFKKFFSTKKDKNGTGLGLSIVQSVIHEHNAKLSLDSNEELTTFTVEFSSPDLN